MSATKIVTLRCDLPMCHAIFESHHGIIDNARAQARRSGWATSTAPAHPSFDYCPAHISRVPVSSESTE